MTVNATPPVIVVGATATPNPVIGTTTVLSVVATNGSGITALTYTWSATAKPTGASPLFSINGNTAAAISIVTFDQSGNYTFTVNISDGALSTRSSVNVTVDQTLTTIVVTPSVASMATSATQQFTAAALDQLENR